MIIPYNVLLRISKLESKLEEAKKFNPCHSGDSGKFCSTGGGGGGGKAPPRSAGAATWRKYGNLKPKRVEMKHTKWETDPSGDFTIKDLKGTKVATAKELADGTKVTGLSNNVLGQFNTTREAKIFMDDWIGSGKPT